MKRRVVITGTGMITPLGKSVQESWQGLREGKTGFGPITLFDAAEYKTQIAAEVKDFKASDFMDRKAARKMGRFTQFAVTAANEALKQSQLLESDIDKSRVATILGVGIGGMEVIEEAVRQLETKGPESVSPMTIPRMISNEAAGYIAILHGITGPCSVVTTACSSGTDAIGAAFNAIRYGQVDAAVTGGAEAPICGFGVSGFNKLKALSTRNDEPNRASRPFDRDRGGFVMGEGAGILVLEEYESAKKRGASILGEIKGFGMSCDANHLTAPLEDGTGSAQAMRVAMQDAELSPESIGYVNAHGTGTALGDPVETKALKLALGDHAYKVPISSTKSMMGHLLGGAGAVETIVCVKSIEDQFVPPTVNLENPSEECDLDYVPLKGREAKIEVAMTESLGFGGHNSVLLVGKV